MTHFPPFVENCFEIKHHAGLFGIMAKYAVEDAGEQGKEALGKAVRKYGQERGHRMALRARRQGDDLSMIHFRLYGEWIPSPNPTLTEHQDLPSSPTLISRITKCPWNTYWREDDVSRYAQVYCEYVDKALVEGFNPTLKLDVNATLSRGNEFCEFVWHGVNKSTEMTTYMAKKRSILGTTCKKSWEYHTAHLYSTIAHTLMAELGERGKVICEHTLKEYGEKFGNHYVSLLQRYQSTDFSSIHYPETKITIIGFGHLMESLFPRIIQRLDPARISTHLNATISEKNLVQEKTETFGIPVSHLNNIQTLLHLKPDIIFFAPPPHLARDIIQTDLGPYYAELRAKSLPLPDLYAFPPIPPVAHYQQILGEDVHVVTILPNDVRTINNRPIMGEGHHFCSFSKPWPMYNYERLTHVLGETGVVIPFEPNEIMPILATRVLTTALIQVVLELHESFSPLLQNISHQLIAHECRVIFLRNSSYISPEALLLKKKSPHNDLTLTSILTPIIQGWYNGIMKYCSEVQLSPTQINPIVDQMFDLILRQIHGESLEKLQHHLTTAATKGGLLENCLLFIRAKITPLLRDHLQKTEIHEWIDLQDQLSSLVQEACHLVLSKGNNLTK